MELKWLVLKCIRTVSYTHLCTVIEAGPCVVTQVKSVEKDGYAAVQLGFQDKKEKHTTKPLMRCV